VPAESIEILAPGEQVWGMVSDVTRMGEWSPEAVAAEWLDGATRPVVGARFRGRNKRRASWSTTCTVTAATPGREFAFRVGKGETTWRYDLSPVDGGCRVTESFEIVRVPGPLGGGPPSWGRGCPGPTGRPTSSAACTRRCGG
jgi:hypothetical protein